MIDMWGLRRLGGRTGEAVLTAGCSFLYVIRANCQGELVPEGSDDHEQDVLIGMTAPLHRRRVYR
jgi:hypothetical protein